MGIPHVDVVAEVIKGVEVAGVRPLLGYRLCMVDVSRTSKGAHRLKEERSHLRGGHALDRTPIDDATSQILVGQPVPEALRDKPDELISAMDLRKRGGNAQPEVPIQSIEVGGGNTWPPTPDPPLGREGQKVREIAALKPFLKKMNSLLERSIP